MNKVIRPTRDLTDLKGLSFSELQERFDAMYTDCTDSACKMTVQSLMHELQVHQIELEMQNRELHETQQQLEQARDRYADLYDFAPVCYITFDIKGCILEINLTGAAILGQERERLHGKPFSQWLSEQDLKRFFNHLQYVQQGFHVAIEELQLKLGNGQTLDVRLESVAATQSTDNKPACRSVLINITASKLAEREIKHQAKQLRLITDAMPVLIAYVDQRECYQFVNTAYAIWIQQPREMIIGKTVKGVMGEAIYPRIEQFIRGALAGKAVNFELSTPYHGDSERDFNTSYIPDFSTDGEVMGFFTLIQDVTDTKLLETEDKMRLLETAHVARINTMGEMVAEIAHELNQPLAAISIYSDTLSRMLNKGDTERESMLAALNEVKLQAERAGQVINRLRAFLSKNEIQPIETDINALVKDILQLVGVETKWHGVALKLDFGHAIPAIKVDKILIEQVILNLTRNAIEAMDAIEKDKRILWIKTALGTNNEIQLIVDDSGPGLGVAEIEKAFEPFYSSKQNGMGMGLGICRSIIMTHHGRLWAIPNEHGGTSFIFTLPTHTEVLLKEGIEE